MSSIDPNFLKIDELRLDREWVRQPSLYFEYANKLADARKEAEDLRGEMDVVAAETDKAVRDDPERYGVEKVTESTVKAAVLKSKAYRRALAAYNEARHSMDVMQAAVTALEHRKRALTMLVELHGQNYFADPKITASREARESVEETSKKGARTIGRLKRRNEEDKEDSR